MKQRILVIMVIFTMLIPNTVFGANDRAEIEASEIETAQTIMNKLEILEYSEENLGDTISRVDFAVYLASLLRLNQYEVQDYTYYTDIGKNHYGLKSVNYLTEIGAFDGDGDSKFRPDDAITPIEAAKVVFNTLGYRTYALVTGGDNKAYMDMANKTKLLKGFSKCSDLNRGELAVLLLRAGLINKASVEALDGDNLVYNAEDENTLFTEHWNIYKREGILTSVGITSIVDSNKGVEGYVTLNDERYTYDDVKADELLGRYITAFVKEPDDGKNEFIYAKVNDKKTNETHVNTNKIQNYENYNLKYFDESDKVKNGKISNNAVFIYNGTIAEYDISDKINGMEKGDLYLIDTNDDSCADTVIINNYKTYVVGYIDVENEVIFDGFTKTKIISLKNYMHKKIYDLAGNELALGSISNQNVLNIKESGGVYADIYVSSVIIEGKIGGTYTDEDTNRQGVMLDGKGYLFDENFIKYGIWFENGIFKGRSGESINFIADMFGEIAYITGYGKGAKNIGYIMKIKVIDDTERDAYVRVKLLKSDGAIENIECADKVEVDGEKYKVAEAIDNAISLGDGKVILYKQNSGEKINYIDTTYKGSNESILSLTAAAPYIIDDDAIVDSHFPGTRQWFTNAQTFGGVIVPSPTTIMFKIPDEPEGKEDILFGITNYSVLGDGYTCKCQSYKLSSDNPFDDVIIMYNTDSSDISVKSPLLVINSISQEVNADDEPVFRIKGISRGSELSSLVNENCMKYNFVNYANQKEFTDVDGLGAGDIIGYVMNNEGEISGISLLYDYSDGIDAVPVGMNNSNFGLLRRAEENAVNRVFCKSYKSGVLDLSATLGGKSIWKTSIQSRIPTITVVDTSKKSDMASIGTVNDIQTYEMMNNAAKQMYVQSTRLNIFDMIIYK